MLKATWMINREGKMNKPSIELITADKLLIEDFPEPTWVVPGILPAGLAILAGPPKIGKSWFALQLAKAVGSGGDFLGTNISQGAVLYMALEDHPRRLKKRMISQGWDIGTNVKFFPLGKFWDTIGDLRNGGSDKLAKLLMSEDFQLVVIDTLSRAISGNQKDVGEMTAQLSPIQELAQDRNISVLILDHLRKIWNDTPNIVDDVLGSRSKVGIADTVMGLYRERGKSGYKLEVTGRDVEESLQELQLDKKTGLWSLASNGNTYTNKQVKLFSVLCEIAPARLTDLALVTGQNKGTILHQLYDWESEGKVYKDENGLWNPSD